MNKGIGGWSGILAPPPVDVQRSTPFTVMGVGTNVNDTPIPATEVRGRYVSLQFTGNPTGMTVQFEASNDGTNWANVYLRRRDSAAAANQPAVFNATSLNNSLFEGPVTYRLFRCRISATTSGTVTATAVFSAVPSVESAVDTELPAPVALADATANPTTTLMETLMGAYNGATWDRLRTPNVFKGVTATASGDTALWTPGSGKKVRLLMYMLMLTADAAALAASDFDIILRDGTNATGFGMSVYVPSVSGTSFGNTVSTGWVPLGNGALSAAANSVLNVNLSAALTAGKVRALAAGVEE